MSLQLTLLGTGTSDGVPLIGCQCAVCTSDNPKNKRLRTSAWVHNEDQSISILIDCGPDFRSQALKHGIKRVDAVLVTHTHWDHIAGMDDLRPLALRVGDYIRGNKIDIYIEDNLVDSLKRPFSYIFGDANQIGGGVPAVEIICLIEDQVFYIKGVRIEPLRVMHGTLSIFGFSFNNLSYITDASEVPQKTMNIITGKKHLVINALMHSKHPTHLNIAQSVELITKVGVGNSYLVHTTHDIEYTKVNAALPDNIQVAYDGMNISL